MATIKDVARRAGVSVSTVSYALSGDRPISAERKAVIERAMAELGYRPHAIARSLASKRSRIVALILAPEERGIGLSELSLITCAAQAAASRGYHLVLWVMKSSDLEELDRQLSQELVDAVILMEVHNNDARIPFLRDRGLPFFLFGRDDSSVGDAFVDTDFEATMYRALSHLDSLGHRTVCFVNQSEETLRSLYGPVARAHEAFARYAADMRLSATELLSPADPQEAYRRVAAHLASHPDTTAILVMNDKALAGVLEACRATGRPIPSSISVVALATAAATATSFMPALTAWEMEGTALMELAVGELIARLEGKYFEVPLRVIPCTLVTRASSGPVRANTVFFP